MNYGDYRDSLPGETPNAYWERMAKYEKEHRIDPTKGSTPWPTPRQTPDLLHRFMAWFHRYLKG